MIGVDLHDAEVVADLGTPAGRAAAVDQVAGLAGGSLDGLVTCAGLAGAPSRPGSLLASVNYFGTVALMNGLRPLLTRRHDILFQEKRLCLTIFPLNRPTCWRVWSATRRC